MSPVLHQRLGVGLQLHGHHSPRRQERHRRHRSQYQALLQLDGPFQDPRRGPGTGLRRLRWPAPLRQSPITSTSRPTSLSATLNPASPFLDASVARTPTTFTTYQTIFRSISQNRCSTPSPPSLYLLTSPSATYLHRRNASRSLLDVGTSTRSRPGRRPRAHVCSRWLLTSRGNVQP